MTDNEALEEKINHLQAQIDVLKKLAANHTTLAEIQMEYNDEFKVRISVLEKTFERMEKGQE